MSREEFLNSYSEVLAKFKPYINETLLKNTISTFLSKYLSKELQNNEVNQISYKKEIFFKQVCTNYSDELFYIFISNLFIQEPIKQRIKLSNSSGISDISVCNNNNTSFKLLIDTKSNFIFQKESLNENESQDFYKELKILNYDFNQNQKDDFPIFIIHTDQAELEFNKIYSFPYFPNQNLIFFLTQKLTIIDKLVLLYEISIALNQLYENNFSHQNLSTYSVYINSQKDAYIGNFYHYNKFNSVINELYFYRHSNFENNEPIINDTFSFGILAYSIFEQKNINSLFENLPTQKVNQIKQDTKEYYGFLMSNLNEKSDIKTNDIISKLIEKCLIGDDSCGDFKEILKKIKNLCDHYNVREIVENRVKSAVSSEKYECKLSDIVVGYYLGDKNKNKEILKKLISIEGTQINDDDDLLIKILELFDYEKINEGNQEVNFEKALDLIYSNRIDFNNIFYEEVFDSIIKENYFKSLETNKDIVLNENQKKLMAVSVNANNSYDNIEQMNTYQLDRPSIDHVSNIIPITSLDKFISHVDSRETRLLFVNIIAKELSLIHSLDLFHGELSYESIGIYIDTNKYRFVPSLLLYYHYYKNKKNLFEINQSKKKRKKFHNVTDSFGIIKKNQLKDIKNFFKILYSIDIGLSDEEAIEIKNCDSINVILFILYNLAFKDNQIDREFNYSSYRLTFSSLSRIYYYSNEISSILNENSSIIDTKEIFKSILMFYNDKFGINNEDVKENDVFQLLKIIMEYNEEMNKKNDQIELYCRTNIKKNNDDVIVDYNHFFIQFHYKEANYEASKKLHTKITREVKRKVEMNKMDKRSVFFLLDRYIRLLWPNSNYIIHLEINNNQFNYDEVTTLMNQYGYQTEYIRKKKNEKKRFYIYVNNIQ